MNYLISYSAPVSLILVVAQLRYLFVQTFSPCNLFWIFFFFYRIQEISFPISLIYSQCDKSSIYIHHEVHFSLPLFNL